MELLGRASPDGQAESLLHDGRKVPEAEKKEKDAADKLAEVIKKARSSAGKSDDRQSQRKDQGQSKARQAGAPAKREYDPKRADEPSKFKSVATKSGSWGQLPAAARAAMLAASREEVPVLFQEWWRKYIELLEQAGK
jgi:hypothetical protein